MSSAFIFDALKLHLKARGLTYANVASALDVSEPTIKRIFATRNCTVDRLDAICDMLQVDLAELARGMPRETRLIHRLSPAQEQELISDPALLLMAICALHQLRVEEIVELYAFDQAQCVQLMLRLEKLGILEMHENNRIRLLLARTFAWIPDGPIMRYVKSQTADFFEHQFDQPGEEMRLVTVRISTEARIALLRQVEQLVREYGEQHSADARLPLEQRPTLSLLLAVRTWEPQLFKRYRRR